MWRVHDQLLEAIPGLKRMAKYLEGFRFEARIDLADFLKIAYVYDADTKKEGHEERSLPIEINHESALRTTMIDTHPNKVLQHFFGRQLPRLKLLPSLWVIGRAQVEAQRMSIVLDGADGVRQPSDDPPTVG